MFGTAIHERTAANRRSGLLLGVELARTVTTGREGGSSALDPDRLLPLALTIRAAPLFEDHRRDASRPAGTRTRKASETRKWNIWASGVEPPHGPPRDAPFAPASQPARRDLPTMRAPGRYSLVGATVHASIAQACSAHILERRRHMARRGGLVACRHGQLLSPVLNP